MDSDNGDDNDEDENDDAIGQDEIGQAEQEPEPPAQFHFAPEDNIAGVDRNKPDGEPEPESPAQIILNQN
jgi:hypothetical protein